MHYRIGIGISSEWLDMTAAVTLFAFDLFWIIFNAFEMLPDFNLKRFFSWYRLSFYTNGLEYAVFLKEND